MTRLKFAELSDRDTLLMLAATRKDAILFVVALATDPDQRARHHFLRCAGGVDAGDLEAAYRAGLLAVGRKAGRGQVNPVNPWPVVEAVLAVTAGKAGRRTWKAHHPKTPGRGGAAKRSWLLADADVALCAGPRLESVAEQDQWACRMASLDAEFDQTLDPAGLAVFRAVSELTAARGTEHGALTVVARTATMGSDGRLVLRPGEPPTEGVTPARSVYKAVVKAYRQTRAEVVRIMIARGIEVPTSLT